VNKDAKPVLDRLSMLRTSQWRALAFLAYSEVEGLGAGPQGKFVEILHTIESLTFRQVLLGLNANSMERIYQAGVRALKDHDLEAVIPALVGAFRESYPSAMGQTFALSFIQSISHSSRHLRALYWRVTTSQDRHKGIFKNEIDMDTTHVEHIVPQTPLISGDDQHRYTWPLAFFSAGVNEEVSEFIDELIQEGADDTLEELMEAVIIDDYANVCFLVGEVNSSIKNSPFDQKVPHYMLTPGFDLATVNSFLTVDNLPDGIENTTVEAALLELVDGEAEFDDLRPWIKNLLRDVGVDQDTADTGMKAAIEEHENTESEVAELREWWNVESFGQRKVALTDIILKELRLEEEEFEGVDLSSIIDEDIRKRIKLFMIENGWNG
jgi:hypothetical protein